MERQTCCECKTIFFGFDECPECRIQNDKLFKHPHFGDILESDGPIRIINVRNKKFFIQQRFSKIGKWISLFSTENNEVKDFWLELKCIRSLPLFRRENLKKIENCFEIKSVKITR
jgi:hypothetical protein